MTRSAKVNRNSMGQAVALPMVIIAVMIILIIGMFSFEVARTAVAREQLRSATEAAALAGAAILASASESGGDESQQKAIFAGAATSVGLGSLNSPADSNINASQQKAEFAARAIFTQNDVFGSSLSNLSQSNQNLTAGQANISFQYFDPTNNEQVTAGDPRGQGMKVVATYALPTLTGNAIGLGNSTVILNSESSGGIGPVDVVLCFDCSLFLRAKTKLTRIHRAFNQSTGKIDYDFVPGGITDFTDQGGMRPERLQQQLGLFNPELRGATDNSMPGNFPPGNAQNSGFTDVVVNIDDSNFFQGFNDGEFNFPNFAALVEASRGNLENDSVFQSSGAALSLQGIVTPKAGYQQRYFELAAKHTHPLVEAQAAAQNFMNLLSKNGQAHFGLVSFNTTVGTDEQSTFTDANVGQAYPAGGTGTFPLPSIDLNASGTENNITKISTAVSSLVASGDVNTAGAIERASQMFDTGSRPNAKKAIVIFTDNVPTAQFSSGSPDPEPGLNASLFLARQAAAGCKQKGVAVYVVGLSPRVQSQQEENRAFNIISDAGAHGGQTFQVTDASKLDRAYASVARSLANLSQ